MDPMGLLFLLMFFCWRGLFLAKHPALALCFPAIKVLCVALATTWGYNRKPAAEPPQVSMDEDQSSCFLCSCSTWSPRTQEAFLYRNPICWGWIHHVCRHTQTVVVIYIYLYNYVYIYTYITYSIYIYIYIYPTWSHYIDPTISPWKSQEIPIDDL